MFPQLVKLKNTDREKGKILSLLEKWKGMKGQGGNSLIEVLERFLKVFGLKLLMKCRATSFCLYETSWENRSDLN